MTNLREYENRATEIDGEKTSLEGKYEKLTREVDQQGKVLHRVVDIFINERKTKVNRMKNRHLATLDEQKKKVLIGISEIEQSIKCLTEILDTTEVCEVSAYKSKKADFRELPSQIQFSLPEISSQEINSEKFCKMFSDLLPLSFLIDKKDCGEEPVDGQGPESGKNYRQQLHKIRAWRRNKEFLADKKVHE